MVHPLVWGIYNQPVPVNYTNIAETVVIFKGVKRTLKLRRYLESMGEGNNKTTPVMEDNQATITQIKKDRLTPRIEQMDSIPTCLHRHFTIGNFDSRFIITTLNKVDRNTKPHGGENFQKQLLSMIGYEFYPPEESVRYILLNLSSYNIGIHRGIFLKT